jgi:hypothetical protein
MAKVSVWLVTDRLVNVQVSVIGLSDHVGRSNS